MAIGDLQWEVGQPAGTELISSIDGWVGDNNTALQRLLQNHLSGCNVYNSSTTEITVKPGSVSCTNGTNYRFRRITSNITATASLSASTNYYVYAVADSAAATTFTAEIAAVGSATSGTYVRVISWFRTNSSSQIIDFYHDGNIYNYKTWQSLGTASSFASWTTLDTTNLVPAALSVHAFGAIGRNNAAITNDNTVSVAVATDRTNVFCAASAASNPSDYHYWSLRILTANTLYFEGENTSPKALCAGFFITENGYMRS